MPPIRGNRVDPTPDTHTPVHPEAEAVALQILEIKRVPRRPVFHPSHLATDVGGSVRHWQREFQLGNLEGFQGPEGWETYWPFLVKYVAARQNIVETN